MYGLQSIFRYSLNDKIRDEFKFDNTHMLLLIFDICLEYKVKLTVEKSQRGYLSFARAIFS